MEGTEVWRENFLRETLWLLWLNFLYVQVIDILFESEIFNEDKATEAQRGYWDFERINY